MTNEIALNCLLNMGTVPAASEPRLLYLLIDVRAGQGAAPLQAPVNIAVVIDVSESMRLPGVKGEEARGTPLRLVPTWANTQPAFGCYTPDGPGIAGAAGLFVLTLEGDAAAAITWFADTALFGPFGLPLTLRG